ncbi:MAG: formylglycine-generating enzyme family protein [Proteobacteria bacterium]|nr:formylglycine-generating enzyme family protein [Pseudomonadota bacterium]MBS0465355.1 formylglycine-generating enzyme family protein [Pseudomonadota bacterium]
MRGGLLAASMALVLVSVQAHADEAWVRIPAGAFTSARRYADVPGQTQLEAFALMRTPVTNAQFKAFIDQHPEWRADRVPRAYAESARYLAQFAPGAAPEHQRPQQPVTGVSWFAAQAYCQAHGARLPTWNEWEYVAAADATRRDARTDPAWRERILGWYGKPSTQPLAEVGRDPPNAYGVQDLHGLVWEWVEDIAALLVVADKRDPGSGNELKFCGGGALNLRDPTNYVVSMRLALLSSLQPADATANLGFRCARSIPSDAPEKPP